MMRRRIQFQSLRVLAAGALALVLVLGTAEAGVAQAQSSPTFTEDIAPILYESCVGCHQPNGIGPMPLLSYEDARPYASRIPRPAKAISPSASGTKNTQRSATRFGPLAHIQ